MHFIMHFIMHLKFKCSNFSNEAKNSELIALRARFVFQFSLFTLKNR